MYVYSGGGGWLLTERKVFQNKLHTSVDKNTFLIAVLSFKTS